MRAAALFATVAAAAVLVALPTQARAAAVPDGMFGLQDWKPPSAALMAPGAGAGIGRWRAPVFWDMVEKTPGAYDWSRYDAAVADAATTHMPLLAMILGCPTWACPNGIGPPTSADALTAQQEFVRQAVLRYGSNGSFWAGHPELPLQPVTEWQVWNEVNHPDYWKPAPDAAQYAALLRGDAAAIRGADPAATVVLAGLSDVPPANAAGFLFQLYAQPDFKRSFDVMAVHAYAPDARGVADLLDGVRQVEVLNGDADRRLWMTEIGWGTSTARLHTPTTEAQQATRMRQSFDMAVGCTARWNLDRAYWFAYADITPAAAGVKADRAGFHTGLVDVNGRPKPAWATLQEFGAGRALPDQRGESCLIPPHEPTTVASAVAPAPRPAIGPGRRAATRYPAPTPQTLIFARRRQTNTRRAKLAFAGSTGSRFQCRLLRGRAHRRWRGCRSRYRSPRLRSGRYRLQVRAVDPTGAADPTPADARLKLRGRRITVTTRTR